MITTRRYTAGAALAVLILAGCSGSPEDPEATPTQTETTSPSPTQGPSPDADPSTPVDPPSDTADPGPDTGTDAFESNALINGVRMDADQARFTLDALVLADPLPVDEFAPSRFALAERATDAGWEPQEVPDPECSVEEAVRARDGLSVEVQPGCDISTGTWVDAFTQEMTDDPREYEVIAGVPVENAWRSGAQGWNEEQLAIFSNASGVLLTAPGEIDTERAGRGPEEWRPGQGAWCAYAIRWVSIKSDYGLAVTSEEERDALREMLGECGSPGNVTNA